MILQIIKSSKNLLLLIDLAKNDKVNIISSGNNYKNEMVKKLLSKNSKIFCSWR